MSRWLGTCAACAKTRHDAETSLYPESTLRNSLGLKGRPMLWWTLRQARSNRPGTRAAAYAKLARSRDARAVKLLAEALLADTEPQETAEASFHSLVVAGVARLEQLLDSDDRALVFAAAVDLANHPDSRLVQALLSAYARNECDQLVRCALLLTLGIIGDPAAIQILARAVMNLHDADAEAMAANHIILKRRTILLDPVLDVLIKALKGGGFWEPLHASWALTRLGWEPRTDEERIWYKINGAHYEHGSCSRAEVLAEGAAALAAVVKLLSMGEARVKHLDMLLELLRRCAAQTPAETLGLVLDLPAELKLWEQQPDRDFGFVVRKRRVDTCLVKELARAELSRRSGGSILAQG